MLVSWRLHAGLERECGDLQINVRDIQHFLGSKSQLKFRVCEIPKDPCPDIRRLMMLHEVKGD